MTDIINPRHLVRLACKSVAAVLLLCVVGGCMNPRLGIWQAPNDQPLTNGACKTFEWGFSYHEISHNNLRQSAFGSQTVEFTLTADRQSLKLRAVPKCSENIASIQRVTGEYNVRSVTSSSGNWLIKVKSSQEDILAYEVIDPHGKVQVVPVPSNRYSYIELTFSAIAPSDSYFYLAGTSESTLTLYFYDLAATRSLYFDIPLDSLFDLDEGEWKVVAPSSTS